MQLRCTLVCLEGIMYEYWNFNSLITYVFEYIYVMTLTFRSASCRYRVSDKHEECTIIEFLDIIYFIYLKTTFRRLDCLLVHRWKPTELGLLERAITYILNEFVKKIPKCTSTLQDHEAFWGTFLVNRLMYSFMYLHWSWRTEQTTKRSDSRSLTTNSGSIVGLFK
jgi:hypothetical protein